jgi:hypothetical protein
VTSSMLETVRRPWGRCFPRPSIGVELGAGSLQIFRSARAVSDRYRARPAYSAAQHLRGSGSPSIKSAASGVSEMAGSSPPGVTIVSAPAGSAEPRICWLSRRPRMRYLKHSVC